MYSQRLDRFWISRCALTVLKLRANWELQSLNLPWGRVRRTVPAPQNALDPCSRGVFNGFQQASSHGSVLATLASQASPPILILACRSRDSSYARVSRPSRIAPVRRAIWLADDTLARGG